MATINYYAKGREIYARQPHIPEGELFLTVHQTDSLKTPEEQAEVIVRILNEEV